MKYLIGGLLGISILGFLNLPLILLGPLVILGAFLIWILGGGLAIKALIGKPLVFGRGYLLIDPLGGFFLLILSAVSGMVVINLWGEVLSRREAGQSERSLAFYLGLTFAFILAMVLSFTGKSLGMIWVCVEATTLVSALLIGFENTNSSLEAAWKYVILCTVGLTFSLFGLILLVHASSFAGISETLDPAVLARAAGKMPQPLLKLAFLMMLFGYASKAGFAPLHSWLPDAYSQAPAPTGALLSGGLVNCSVYALIRTSTIMEAAGDGDFVRTGFLGFGMASLALATLFLFVQVDLKRLLAYSSIEHVGLIAIGLGLGSPMALFAVGVHAFGNSAAKALAFLATGDLVRVFHSQEMNRMVGTIKRLPMGGGGLALAMIALGGLPPFSLFLSELLLVAAALTLGKIFIAGLVLMCSAGTFSGLAYHGSRILLGEDPHHHHHDEKEAAHYHQPSAKHFDAVQNPALTKIMSAGSVWRHLSLIGLTALLLLLPLLFFPPFSHVMETVAIFLGGRVPR